MNEKSDNLEDLIRDTKFSSKQIQILESYIMLCSKEGVADVTLQKVAKELKVSLGTVHYHFGGKQDLHLMEAAIVYISQESMNYISYNIEDIVKRDNFEGIKSYVSTYFDWIQVKTPHALYWIYYTYLSSYSDEFRKLNQHYMELIKLRIHTMLQLGIKNNIYNKFKITDDLISGIHTNLVGSLFLSGSSPTVENFEHYEKVCINACETLVNYHSSGCEFK